MKLSIAIAAFATSIAIAAPAAAERDAPESINVAVSYSDLNLDTEAGRAELRQRLDRAVYDACAFSGTVSFDEQVRCRRDVREALYEHTDRRVRAAFRGDRDAVIGAGSN